MTHHDALKPKVGEEKVAAGIDNSDTEKLAKHLSYALADSYVLYVQTQGVHWNVVGPTFYAVHNLTEEQYEDLSGAIDEIAERIRALGHPSPSSVGEFMELAELTSEPATDTAEKMVAKLANDNQLIAKRMRTAVEAAEEIGDVFTADLLTARIGTHEKAAWMLRSMISD